MTTGVLRHVLAGCYHVITPDNRQLTCSDHDRMAGLPASPGNLASLGLFACPLAVLNLAAHLTVARDGEGWGGSRRAP